jgi:hypothetical protein
MSFLAPKLVLTPLLIASASLAGRRWGAATTGWLVALPLTSGPIFAFIALELGSTAAATAAGGSLVGALGQVAFIVAYVLVAGRAGWVASAFAAGLAFIATVALVPSVEPLVLSVVTIPAIALTVPWLIRGRSDHALPVMPPGRWDIPARAVVATVLVVAISASAPVVGGRAAGIMATFPVYVTVLTTFAHRVAGRREAREILLGLAVGLPGFASFFLVAGGLIETGGLWVALGAALVTAVGLNTVLLAGLRRFAGRSVAATGLSD